VAAGVAVSIGVGDGLGVGLAEGLAVLVGVGLAFGCGEVRDNRGQLQLMVIIAATTAITSAVFLLLSKPDVPFPFGPPVRVRLQVLQVADYVPHLLPGVFEDNILELTRDVTTDVVDGHRVRLRLGVVLAGHDVDQKREWCMIHVRG
jgi:hypothetical protein